MNLLPSFTRHLPRVLRKCRGLFLALFAAAVFLIYPAGLTPLQQMPGLRNGIDALHSLELDSLDFRFRWRGPIPTDPRLLVVAINDTEPKPGDFREDDLAASEALRLMTERTYPWNRKVWARLIERLMSAGVKAVAFDVIFQREMEGDPELKAVLDRYADRIVLATTKQLDLDNRLVFLKPHPGLLNAEDKPAQGFAFYPPDDDGVIRRTRSRTSETRESGLKDFEPDNMTSLAAAAVQIAEGIPPAEQSRALLNFQGDQTRCASVPLADLLIDRIYSSQDPRFRAGAALKDKIVFVGPTAEIFHDVHETPYGAMPGVFIHAQNAASRLLAIDLGESSPAQNFWVALLFVVLPTWVVLRVRQAPPQIGLLLGSGAAFLVVAQLLFTEARLVIPVVPPLFGLILVGCFGVAYNLLVEQLQGAHVRSVLDRYVSKNVAKIVIETRDNFENSLRGERKSVTALFSDIRGFTSIFETSDPEKLVAQLNEYFLKMVDAVVLHQDGTLQKFIGDAIMAVWGDTHSAGAGGDAARAVRTGLEMRAALEQLNAQWKELPDRVPLQIGVGINHGEVICGELGHPQRMEFTVLGDAINLAARLESATKQFHCDVLVGQSVEELTRAEFIYRRVDLLRLKGKNKPVEVYIPLSTRATPPPPWLEGYHAAIGLYRARRFEEAMEGFRETLARIGGEDFLCRMYLERCGVFTKTPPAPDWDGGHTLTEK